MLSDRFPLAIYLSFLFMIGVCAIVTMSAVRAGRRIDVRDPVYYGLILLLVVMVDLGAPDAVTLSVLRVSIGFVCVWGLYDWAAINHLINAEPIADRLSRRTD